MCVCVSCVCWSMSYFFFLSIHLPISIFVSSITATIVSKNRWFVRESTHNSLYLCAEKNHERSEWHFSCYSSYSVFFLSLRLLQNLLHLSHTHSLTRSLMEFCTVSVWVSGWMRFMRIAKESKTKYYLLCFLEMMSTSTESSFGTNAYRSRRLVIQLTGH